MILYIIKSYNQLYLGRIRPFFPRDYPFEFLLIYDKGETVRDKMTERGVVSWWLFEDMILCIIKC
jgi:hypothetical protein